MGLAVGPNLRNAESQTLRGRDAAPGSAGSSPCPTKDFGVAS